MCKFFSFVGLNDSYLFLDWNYRKDHLQDNCDSHTYILTYFGISPEKQQNYSYYEYNPITKEFNIDRAVIYHNHDKAKAFVECLDFTTICPYLIIKKIKNSLVGKPKEVTEEVIKKMKEYIELRKSINNSIRGSIRDSIWGSIMDSIMDSIWGSIRDSIWDSIRDSIWNSIRYSIRYSIWDPIYIYLSTFFDIKYKYDFSSCINLWNKGFLVSYDGNTYRLHSGKEAKIVHEIKG